MRRVKIITASTTPVVQTELTPQQKIIAAYLHYVRGLSQSDITVAMGGPNNGRVNEAIRKIGHAAGLCEPGYKERDTNGA